jgi:hypothetical protein
MQARTRAVSVEKRHITKIIDIAMFVCCLRTISISKSKKTILKKQIGTNKVLNHRSSSV